MEQFIKEYDFFVYNICIKILRNEQDAWDATQNTFLSILCSDFKDNLDAIENKEGFLTTRARYKCIDIIRKRLFFADIDLTNFDNGQYKNTALSLILEGISKDCKNGNIDLTDIEAQILNCLLSYEVNPKSNEEIACYLGIPLKTAKNSKKTLFEKIRKQG